MQDLLTIVAALLPIIALWKIFEKAGQAGWKAIIPIYDLYVLMDLVKKPWWWLLLMFVPVVNVIIWFLVLQKLAQSFGKSTGFTIGLFVLPFIFFPILAFGDNSFNPNLID